MKANLPSPDFERIQFDLKPVAFFFALFITFGSAVAWVAIYLNI